MAYQATVLPVMIASPSDVSEEREIIRKIIHEWNDINADQSKIVLIPIGWETHSSPDLGGRPQELINSRLLKNCDLLIGVFWTRFGTPTGEAQSGTEEEIKKHIAQGKPAMLYFSSKPVAPESIDTEQYQQVQNFKKSCYKLGLVESFDNTHEFEKKIHHQLQLIFHQNPYLKNIITEVKVEESPNTSSTLEHTSLLSKTAEELLTTAALSQDGTILMLNTLGGRFIQTGDKSYGGKPGRNTAKWEAALRELIQKGLIIERGNKGELFELTHKGWKMADNMRG